MIEDFHDRLQREAHRLWVEHLVRCEDDDISPEIGAQTLSVAAAMCEATILGVVEQDANRVVPDERLREIAEDFELVLLKTIADVAPAAMSAQTRQRMHALDRRVKRARGMLDDGAGEA